MAKASLDLDLSGLIRDLEAAGSSGRAAAKYGLHEAAGKVADAVREEAGRLPYKGSTVSQIQAAVGIAKFSDTADGADTSVSFDGYFQDSGFPIAFFVNEVEHGTSRLQANPFVRRAANRAKAQAEAEGNRAAEEFAQRIIDNIKDT